MVARGLRYPTAGAHAGSGRTPSGPRCRAPRPTSARPPIPTPRTPRTTGARTGDRTSEPLTLPGAPREWGAQEDSYPGTFSQGRLNLTTKRLPNCPLHAQVQGRPPRCREPALPPPLCVGRWGRRRSGVRRGRQRRRRRPPRRRAGPRERPRRRGMAGVLVGRLAVEGAWRGGGHEGGAAEGRGEGEAEDQQGEGHLQAEEALLAVSDIWRFCSRISIYCTFETLSK